MAKMTKAELTLAGTQLAERVLGKTLEYGSAHIDIKPLSSDEILLARCIAGKPSELTGLAMMDAMCRLGITGWTLAYEDGEPLEYRTEGVGHLKTQAVPQALLEAIPLEARAVICQEITALSNLSEPEIRRLDFTLPLASGAAKG